MVFVEKCGLPLYPKQTEKLADIDGIRRRCTRSHIVDLLAARLYSNDYFTCYLCKYFSSLSVIRALLTLNCTPF